jgi:hypothetical protein
MVEDNKQISEAEKIKQVDSVPVLGTGKMDYVAIQKLVANA